ncbi:HlyD family secretion protein [Pseudomonas mediterranea]|uniref:Membrane fusion protein, multidrug efflux system n=1 Tax=Pseudomonas mediterranea TaxID=183795 RepID=A0AAX2DEM5_9PSED|nr:HlyD family secretion protein [Pseudomonas mediterranea]KGU82896.1 DSBA oxidoreductase [Pseudomonas mediterranea CFBP 5447]MBL0845891.1 HlyD family secretion protein [Pseudomonas mediterranea]UZE03295.1 HlyD family secretion protein [Pseudomonas mediterranea]CAH0238323.1 putative multidrug resistance protein EmrK [Pseudomonas mediterranea]SDU63218.1 membrane fusion protein, multidrug efflux system [Pseudomonas mediterranea]
MALPKKARISAALLLTVVACSVFYLNRSESSASTQSTDDAYVHADFTTVAPQVSGTVETVLVEDNQPVKKGDLLAVIDDRDFVATVNVAKAQVASAQAGIANLEARLIQQQTVIRQAQAAVAADDAALKLAKVNHTRYRNLAADGSGTVQARQQAEAQLSVQQAGLEKSQAALQAARQQVDILKADLDQARATLAHAQAAQAIAELKLSYTRITAPINGTIGEKSVRVGAFVNAGKPLLAIVPLDAVYITANFRETQLARVQTGQAVDIEVDALPGETLTGTVQSLGPASGVSYSAIAPHNATGNFTKIVQRLPVRIRLDPDQPATAKLRVGMSVTPHIRIRG